VAFAHREIAERVLSPARPVEVAGEKPTGISGQKRVDPDGVLASEMRCNDAVRQGQVVSSANPLPDPSPLASWRVSLPSGPFIDPQDRIDVLASAKQRTEQSNLLARWGIGIDVGGWFCWWKEGKGTLGDSRRGYMSRQTEKAAQPRHFLPEMGALTAGRVELAPEVCLRFYWG
jgi:hypothetical protein